MCSACKAVLVSLLALPAFAAPLRVCADPNNLPFSNTREEGFDNKIARLAANELGRAVSFVWAPERGDSFVRKTLLAGKCDVLMGVPSTYREAAPTAPYYRSTYVFVSRRDRTVK